jgi:5-oxoprolinase (ATP-hydrolysing)
MAPWKIWVDTGGTFTDTLAIDTSGNLHRLKVLSSGLLRGRVIKHVQPDSFIVSLPWPVKEDIYTNYTVDLGSWRGKVHSVSTETGLVKLSGKPPRTRAGSVIELHTNEEAPVFAARLLTKSRIGDEFPEITMNLGSTRGTNAILERKGAKTTFIVTKGFKDLLVIGNQQRSDLFALKVTKPPLYYDNVIEVDERISASGEILQPMNEPGIQRVIEAIRKSKAESIAIALLNSYRNPVHEKQLWSALTTAGFRYVSTSSELSKQIKILDRAETTVANAYLDPVIHHYVSNIRAGLRHARLQIMASYGGLMSSDFFKPKDSLLSGPAGGVVGAALKAGESGIHKIISFDMGGTSTDVSLYDGRFDYRFDSRVGSLRILSPSLAIDTIAAGGGSICTSDGQTFSVGPESAGAQPGPACYGRGGPLTITDVNLLLGRLDPQRFAIPLSVGASRKAFDGFCRKARIGKSKLARTRALLSLVSIANEKMAGALRRVSTQLGHRPSDYTLLSFGGAGGQHACALADLLGISSVLIPYDAGLLSAYGIGHAKTQRFSEKLLITPLSDLSTSLANEFRILEKKATEELIRDGQTPSSVEIIERLVFMRFKGQESVIEIKISGPDAIPDLSGKFKDRYESIFGHWLSGQSIEVESIRIVAQASEKIPKKPGTLAQKYVPRHERIIPLTTHEGTMDCRVYSWEQLEGGARISGPALIISNNSTSVVDPGWRFDLDANNNALLTRSTRENRKEVHSSAALVELFTNRFTFVAQEMGAMLQRTSFSVNVKERLDFSCAVLDDKGYLVVNAPHIPVHLGSLGICVREVLKKIKIRPGDVIITNHPAYGGSHLPDVTLIKGVFVRNQLVAYIANRAHHAEIGGTRPGSMPADATCLEEEGVIIEPTYLVRNGVANWGEIERLFTASAHPTRLWHENRADLNGALASVTLGGQLMTDLCERYGADTVRSQMKKLRKQASSILRVALKKFPSRTLTAAERLDDGSLLRVALQKKAGKLIIDFTGSSNTHPGNLNATRAIVQSVVLYVLRVFIDLPIPMNEGLLDDVRIVVPRGILSPDFSVQNPPAVVGGNTEVSQRLTDTLLKAMKLSACSQGTMNNFLFGNASLGYYETICGGTGAGKSWHGSPAVHHHMTNTRITDPEVLEVRYPVRLERFQVREGSGGNGRYHGGNGVIREIRFLEKMEISILSQHRKERPYGLRGGGDGKVGSQWIVSNSGIIEKLDGIDNATVLPGESVVIQTPGGGGYGRESS